MNLPVRLTIVILAVFCFLTVLPDNAIAAKSNGDNPIINYLSFHDTDIKDVLYTLAQKSGMNIVLDQSSLSNDKQSKRVTFNLSNIHLYNALDLIVSSAGLTYSKVGSAIVVGEKNKIGQNFNTFKTERIKLQYADPYKIKDTLVSLGIVDYDNIFVYGEFNNEEKKNSKEKDKETGDKEENTTNSNSNSNDSEGNTVTSLTTSKLTENRFRKTDKADAVPASVLVIRDTPANISKIKEVIKSLDQPAPKILVEAKIVEINETGMKQLGVDWITDKSSGALSTLALYEDNGSVAGTKDTAGTPGRMRLSDFRRSALNFSSIIKAQIDRGNAKVLSSPKISTLDGQRAFIFVGDKIPYIAEREKDDDGNITDTISFLSIGVNLEIIPMLTESKDIQLKIYSEVSSIKEKVELVGDLSFPSPTTRQAETITRVKAGETIVLGGLIADEERRSMSKLPILGDIPILKHLFSWSSSEKNRSEVVISITPYIVE